MTWERAGVIIGAVIGLGTIGGYLGYGTPWMSAAAGTTLEQDVRQLAHAQQDAATTEKRDAISNRVTNLQTQKTILLLEQTKFKPGTDAYALVQSQIDTVNYQIKHPN